MPSQAGHSHKLILPTCTDFISSLHLGQSILPVMGVSARCATAPQWEQNFDPTNIMPKQEGQATVASRAPQKLHFVESDEAAAPHEGQRRVSAVGMVLAS
jgi:hypothetical protein